MSTVIMKTTAVVVVPIIFVVAIALFLQGHSLPGGGFIGGVLTVVAFALIYVGHGLEYLEIGVLGRTVDPSTGIFDYRSVRAYRRLFTIGLSVIVASGFAGFLFGEPFLAQGFVHRTVPLFGEVELASALLFDAGVYCVVVGGLLTILSVVGNE
ncbi:MAG: MnhB domain-containing protein [Halobacteriota archaeon]